MIISWRSVALNKVEKLVDVQSVDREENKKQFSLSVVFTRVCSVWTGGCQHGLNMLEAEPHITKKPKGCRHETHCSPATCITQYPPCSLHTILQSLSLLDKLFFSKQEIGKDKSANIIDWSGHWSLGARPAILSSSYGDIIDTVVQPRVVDILSQYYPLSTMKTSHQTIY